MRHPLPLAILFVAGSLAAQAPPPRVVPGIGVGPVTPQSTYASLRARLGPKGVDTGAVYLGEGLYQPGGYLYPEDSLRTAAIFWSDTIGLTKPLGVLISTPGTRWQLPDGITIGTSVDQLETLNGRPFTFSGFDWDYGGRGADWQGGRLASILGATMTLGVTLDTKCPQAVSQDDFRTIVGDTPVPSDSPVVRKVCVVVQEIWIGFRTP